MLLGDDHYGPLQAIYAPFFLYLIGWPVVLGVALFGGAIEKIWVRPFG